MNSKIMEKQSELIVADNLHLPLEIVTETVAILAKKGSGKTYTGSVLAEEMIGAGAHVVALDPLGVWWGLRAGADGSPEDGLPVLIIGGDHGDLPLDPLSGAAVAGFVTGGRASCILDLSWLTRSENGRFLADFLSELFRTNREPLHLFVDEADSVAPQTPGQNEQPMLDAMDAIVRRGRSRGLGTTLITQRPAVLSKNVLSQVEMLIAMRLTATLDRKAIDGWFSAHATDSERKAVLESLATLAVGEAWVWSPNYLSDLRRVQVRRRNTFDASATPKVGEATRAVKGLAQMNLPALTEAFASRAEEARANDPVRLKAQVAELTKRLSESPAPERVEVPVATDEERAQLADLRDSMVGTGKDLINMAGEITARLSLLDKPATVAPVAAPEPLQNIFLVQDETITEPLSPVAKRSFATGESVPQLPPKRETLKQAQQAILDTLASGHPKRLTRQRSGVCGVITNEQCLRREHQTLARCGLSNVCATGRTRLDRDGRGASGAGLEAGHTARVASRMGAATFASASDDSARTDGGISSCPIAGRFGEQNEGVGGEQFV